MIGIDTIKDFKDYMLCMEKESNEFLEQFDEHILYIKGFSEFVFYLNNGGDDTEIVKDNSPMFIYELLAMNPKRSLEKLKEAYRFNDEKSEPLEITKKDHSKRKINAMMQFLNVSTYLYNYALNSGVLEDKLKELLELLVVAAAAEYGSLYSGKGKDEFAYYFEKFLTSPNETIRAYNTDEKRYIYSKMIDHFREKVDDKLLKTHKQKNEVMHEICYSNLYISYGKRGDTHLSNDDVYYYITIIKYYINPVGYSLIPDGDPTLNTKFK